MKNKILKLSVIGIVIASIGFSIYYSKTKETATTLDEVEMTEVTVKKDDITIGFIADGYAELTASELSFPQLGTIEEIFVDEGDMVKKDDIIGTIESTDFKRNIQTAKNNLEEAILNLEKTKQQKNIDKVNDQTKTDTLEKVYISLKDEYEKMLQIDGAYSQKELEDKKVSVENAKSSYEASSNTFNINYSSDVDININKLNVEKAKLELEIAEEKLEDTVLKSPIYGEVLAIENEVGELVHDDVTFATIANKKDLIVIAEISEIDLEQIEIGQKVDIEFEALLNQKFIGTVTKIDPLATKDSTGIITYYVDITLNEGQEKIKDGMTAVINFVLAERLNVINIPNKSVKRVDNKQIVEVVSEDGSTEMREIKTGLTDGTNVEVIKGLKVNEKVIVKK